MADMTDDTLDLLRRVAEDAADLISCNCSYSSATAPEDRCDGTCTHSMAVRALTALREHNAAGPFLSKAARGEHPWCAWTLAFASESDWDTASSFGFSQLKSINLLLTTADGHSRPVRVIETQYIDDRDDETDRRAGIEVVEIDTEHYEPIPGRDLERVAYEDIREVVVF